MLVLIKDEKDIHYLMNDLRVKLNRIFMDICNAKSTHDAINAKCEFNKVWDEYYQYIEYMEKRK